MAPPPLPVTPLTVEDSSLARLYRGEIAKHLAINASSDRAERAAKRQAGVRALAEAVHRDVFRAAQVGGSAGLRPGAALRSAVSALQEAGLLQSEADWAAVTAVVESAKASARSSKQF